MNIYIYNSSGAHHPQAFMDDLEHGPQVCTSLYHTPLFSINYMGGVQIYKMISRLMCVSILMNNVHVTMYSHMCMPPLTVYASQHTPPPPSPPQLFVLAGLALVISRECGGGGRLTPPPPKKRPGSAARTRDPAHSRHRCTAQHTSHTGAYPPPPLPRLFWG